MSNSSSSLSAFFNFLLQDGELTNQEIREGLLAEGVQVHRVRRELKELLQGEELLFKTSWVRKAQEERLRFQKKISEKRQKIVDQFKDVKELVQGIKNGDLGLGLQERLQVQFRNRNSQELSHNDLLRLLDDQTILELLEKEESEPNS